MLTRRSSRQQKKHVKKNNEITTLADQDFELVERICLENMEIRLWISFECLRLLLFIIDEFDSLLLLFDKA